MYYKYPGARIYNLITPKFRDCHLNCSAIKVNYGEVANELITGRNEVVAKVTGQ